MKTKPTATTKFTSKLGPSKGVPRSRIWLQGARLIAAGFTPGATFYAVWTDAKLTLVRSSADLSDPNAPNVDARKVSGKTDVPIIDIVGARVRDTFGAGECVAVAYAPGRIVITKTKETK